MGENHRGGCAVCAVDDAEVLVGVGYPDHKAAFASGVACGMLMGVLPGDVGDNFCPFHYRIVARLFALSVKHLASEINPDLVRDAEALLGASDAKGAPGV